MDMNISKNDKEIMRRLGYEYMEAARRPVHREKMKLWKALNRSEMQRPMVCIDQLPVNELNETGELTCHAENLLLREMEKFLRLKLYQWNHFPADMVLEPFITVPRSLRCSGYGIQPEGDFSEPNRGTTAPSRHFYRILNDFEDVEKIIDLSFATDVSEDNLRMAAAEEAFGSDIPLLLSHGANFHLGVWDYLSMFLTVDGAYMDMIDRPEFVHACMERLTQSTLAGIRQLNELKLHNDIENVCHCSYAQYTYDLAKANQVNLEFILKDISTIRYDPERLTKWSEIAMEVASGSCVRRKKIV